MLKTAFEFGELSVVAYGRSADGLEVEGLVIKFVDENGDRIYPYVPEKDMGEIEEIAMEQLTSEQFESELVF